MESRVRCFISILIVLIFACIHIKAVNWAETFGIKTRHIFLSRFFSRLCVLISLSVLLDCQACDKHIQLSTFISLKNRNSINKCINKLINIRSTLKPLPFSSNSIFDLIQFRRKCLSRGHLAKCLGSRKDLSCFIVLHFGEQLMYCFYLCLVFVCFLTQG